MHSVSVSSKVAQAVGMAKVDLLAQEIDNLKGDLATHSQTIDEAIETIDLDSLAQSQGVSVRYLRDRIAKTLNCKGAIKIGGKYVIRKNTWLRFLELSEESQD